MTNFEATFTLSRIFPTAAEAMAALHRIALTGIDGYTVDSLNVYPSRKDESEPVAAPAAATAEDATAAPAAQDEPERKADAPTSAAPEAPAQPAPQPDADESLSDEALRALCQDKAKAAPGNRVLVRDALKAIGVDAVSNIPADKRAEFRAAIEAI